MSEKRGRGQPKFEPTQDQRGQVKQMKALGMPEDRICKTITNPQEAKADQRSWYRGDGHRNSTVGDVFGVIIRKRQSVSNRHSALSAGTALRAPYPPLANPP